MKTPTPSTTAPALFHDISIKDTLYEGFPVPKEYWHQLHCCSEYHPSEFTFEKGALALWNLQDELLYANGDSPQKLMMAIAFIASCEFEHSIASFKPFKQISRPPRYHKVRDAYVELCKHGLSQEVNITSTLKLELKSTMFERVPFKVIQHAKLNTATFDLTPTYADVIWDEGAAPEICPGTFVPREQCKWLYPDHP